MKEKIEESTLEDKLFNTLWFLNINGILTKDNFIYFSCDKVIKLFEIIAFVLNNSSNSLIC
jgi:hypothetical protein